MTSETLDGNYGRSIAIDLCHDCGALWFDGRESLALAPGAVLRLFQLIHEGAADRRAHPFGALACPHCTRSLVATTDQQRNTPFSYWRCAGGDGRFITFGEFLREKAFVRPLDARELAELRSHVKSVRCSSCGAGVDLERGSTCGYCRAPVSMLDPHQVDTIVRGLKDAEAKRQTIDPALPARLVMDRLDVERLWQALDTPHGQSAEATVQVRLPGLLEAGIAAVADLLRKRG
jgi:hypothetical protein